MANIIEVTALNKYVRSILESDPVLTDIAIRGEISNFNRHYKTGHCYFTLKDNNSSVKAVMFRSDVQRQSFSPENGMRVVARCRVSLFERDGAFQLYVEDLFPDGQGAMQIAFDQLKQRLAAEGLFALEQKKELPAYPTCVGLVTSKTGAALQDILKVASIRCGSMRFLLAPVTVQGDKAAPEIVKAIKALDADEQVDVIIIARGGGSAEDLWLFNNEQIARTVYTAKTPVVSAIGHEIDFTILDFVADVRAPTPSAAAEMVLPDQHEAARQLLHIYTNISKSMQSRLDSWYNNLKWIQRHPALLKCQAYPLQCHEKLQHTAMALQKNTNARLSFSKERLMSLVRLAGSINPYAVLERGYAVVSTGDVRVRCAADTRTGDLLQVRLADGELDCRVEDVRLKQEAVDGEEKLQTGL